MLHTIKTSAKRFGYTLLTVSALCLGASAATITVTNTNDSGAGSMRQAIAGAASGDTINFSVTGTITLTSGELVIDKNLTIIQGPGASLLSISGNSYGYSVFSINSGVTAMLDGMSIREGRGGFIGGGGGINNSGTLTVTNSTISNNGAGVGGGIYNRGTLIVSNSTISGNSSSGSGGGIANNGILTVSNSIISGNSTAFYPGGGYGGGIYNGGSLTVSNSIISGNTSATGNGGGLGNSGGNVTINNSTVSGNAAYLGGGGVYNTPECNDFDTCPSNTAYVYITNSTIAGNTDGGIVSWGEYGGFLYSVETLVNTIVADGIDGTIDSASHNLIGDSASSSGIQNGVNGNIVGVNPLLGPLQNNGGPTMTHALLAGSPAIDAGDNCVLTANGCGNGNPALPTDQRGFQRLVDGNSDGNAVVDIGAFEIQLVPTAAAATVSGRVFDPDGKRVVKAEVSITDARGTTKTVMTKGSGVYTINGVIVGRVYIMTVQHKNYIFQSKVVAVNGDLSGQDFMAEK
jgi:hypothetical protein